MFVFVISVIGTRQESKGSLFKFKTLRMLNKLMFYPNGITILIYNKKLR